MKSIYGVTVGLVALLIISSTGGVYYYYEYQNATQSKNQYLDELNNATLLYDQLASNYNSSLSLYNETFSLLARVVGVVNTSLPAYQQASAELSRLWTQYLGLRPASGSLYTANVLIDFGNGTSHWYNDTRIQPGWNMYTTTVVLTHGNLQAQWYPQYQEHLVLGIDGVLNSKTQSWFLWTFDKENQTSPWQVPSQGADDLPVYNGSVFAWTYCGETSTYEPTCTP